MIAHYNWGRWIVECTCGAGLLVTGTGVCRCRECGLRHQVSLPVERREVERLCAKRAPANRNWLPGESVANLIAENIMHGVG